MADIIRYVNPLSTGGDGTTTALSGANAAYASLNAAFAAEVINLTTNNDQLYFRCFGAAEDTVPLVLPAGYVSNSTNKIIVENATGESGGDPSLEAWDTNAYRLNPTITDNNGVINGGSNDVRNLDYLEFRNIQIGGVFNGTINQSGFRLTASPWTGEILLDSCVFRIAGSCTGATLDFLGMSSVPLTIKARNNVAFVDSGFTGTATTRFASVIGASATLHGHNNTLDGFVEAISESSALLVSLGNNLFVNNTTDTAGTTYTSIGGNVTDNANFGVMTSTGNTVSQTFNFEASSYKLASTDSGAAENGVDLSANADLPVTVDAFGTARPAQTNFDAGYHERTVPTRTATPGEAGDVPGGVITFTLTGFAVPPDSATLNGVAVSISNATTGSVDITLPALSDFVFGQSHAGTRWNTAQQVRIFEGAEFAQDSVQVFPPDTDGPDQWFGSAATPSPDTVFPPETVLGDDYFVERVLGTNLTVLDTGSVSSESPTYEVNARIFDVSEGSWSSIENTHYDAAVGGSIQGTSASSGAITLQAAISGTAQGTSVPSGSILRTINFSGSAQGSSVVLGAFTGSSFAIAGSVSGTSAIVGSITAAYLIAGSVQGSATVTATLDIGAVSTLILKGVLRMIDSNDYYTIR